MFILDVCSSFSPSISRVSYFLTNITNERHLCHGYFSSYCSFSLVWRETSTTKLLPLPVVTKELTIHRILSIKHREMMEETLSWVTVPKLYKDRYLLLRHG